MFWFYYLLLYSTIISFVLTGFFAYYSKRFVTATIITTLLAIGAVINYHLLDEIKSMPLDNYSDKFTIVSYIEDKPEIFLWILEETRDYPVTVVIPWTEEDAEKLAENKDEIEQNGLEGSIIGDDDIFRKGILQIFKFDYTNTLKK